MEEDLLSEVIFSSVKQNEIEEARWQWLQDIENKEKFLSYSMILCQSSDKHENKEAVKNLEELLTSGIHTQECLYYLSIVEFRLKHYEKARTYSERLLRESPDSGQAQQMYHYMSTKHEDAKKQATRDTVVAGGIIAVGAAVVTALLLSGRKR